MGDAGEVHMMSPSYSISGSAVAIWSGCPHIMYLNSGAARFGEQQMYTLVHLPCTDSPWLIQRKKFTPASHPVYEKLILLAFWTIVYLQRVAALRCVNLWWCTVNITL